MDLSFQVPLTFSDASVMWHAAVHEVAKSQTQLKDGTTTSFSKLTQSRYNNQCLSSTDSTSEFALKYSMGKTCVQGNSNATRSARTEIGWLLHRSHYIILCGASPVAQMVKNLPAMKETRVLSLGQKDPLKKGKEPTPVFLPGEFQGQRNLAGCLEISRIKG